MHSGVPLGKVADYQTTTLLSRTPLHMGSSDILELFNFFFSFIVQNTYKRLPLNLLN